jgi:hypothetical protein
MASPVDLPRYAILMRYNSRFHGMAIPATAYSGEFYHALCYV